MHGLNVKQNSGEWKEHTRMQHVCVIAMDMYNLGLVNIMSHLNASRHLKHIYSCLSCHHTHTHAFVFTTGCDSLRTILDA